MFTESPSRMARARGPLAFAAAATIGAALQVSHGHYVEGREWAVWLVVAAAAMAGIAALLPAAHDEPSSGPAAEASGMEPPPALAMMMTLAVALAALAPLVFPAGLYLTRPLLPELTPLLLSGAGAVVAATLLREARTDRRAMAVAAVVLGAAFLFAGISVVRVSPSPIIDVWTMQQGAAEALLHGKNPYAAILPDAWPPGKTVTYYPYTPLPLLLTLPGRLVGDVRYALLAALLVGQAAVAVLAVPARGLAWRCALLLLAWFALRPTGIYQLEQSYNEPFAMALLAVSVAVWRRGRLDAAAAIFGLAVTSKQYLVAVAPLIVLFPGARLRHLAIAAATGMATLVPFAIADAGALWDDVIGVLVRWPPRYDALTFASWLHDRHGAELPSIVAAAAPLAALAAVGLRGWVDRGRRDLSRVLAGMAFVLLSAFVVAKQAHANYYDLAATLLVLSVVTSLAPRAGEATGR